MKLLKTFRSYEDAILQSNFLATTLACSISLAGGLAHGFSVGAVSASMEHVKRQWPNISQPWLAILPSAFIFGGAVGALLAGAVLKCLGTKLSLLLVIGVQVFSSCASIFSPWFEMLVASRALFGFTVGLMSALVSAYVLEVSPRSIKGAITTTFSIFINAGIMAGFLCGFIFSDFGQAWKWLFGLSIVFDIPFALLFLIMPESPSWARKTAVLEIAPTDIPLADMLVERSFTPSGTGVIISSGGETSKPKTMPVANAPLPPPPSATTPVAAVTPKEEESKSTGAPLVQAPPAPAPRTRKSAWVSFREDLKVLFGPENWKLATAGIMLAAANQLTGLNAVTFYSTSIFSAVGLKGRLGVLVSALVIGGVSVIGNIIAILLIDRISRRLLILGGLTMVNISNALICGAMWTIPQPQQEYVSIALIALFVLSFQSSIGAAIWVCVNELFKDPLLKQFGSGIILGFLWTFSLALGLAFPPLVSSLGIAGTFMIFSLIGVVSQVFLSFLMPFKSSKASPKLPLTGKKTEKEVPLQLSSAQTPKDVKPAAVAASG